MAIKKPHTIYIADTGKEFIVEKMNSSHLLNEIMHHEEQVVALDRIKEWNKGIEPEKLSKRRQTLVHTVEVLSSELLKRDPDDDVHTY